jgi:hypothetical protein
MPKPIPTLGLTNWGQPLNEHLAQLNNPITGGINTFDTFSQRPTTLTAVDNGKTYLYTQTGNIHQWTGTAWEVLMQSNVNAKDFGVIGDGVTDDADAIQVAIENVFNRGAGNLFFPSGKYRLNRGVVIMQNVAIIGEGMFHTIFDHYGNDVCFTALDGELGSRVEFSNFTLYGHSGANAKGIVFGNIAWARLNNLIIFNYTNGTGIEASNTRIWTEISQWDNVTVRETMRCIAFTRTNGTESFSNTRMINVTLIPLGGGVGMYIAPTCLLYASTLNIKGNFTGLENEAQCIGIHVDGGEMRESHYEILFETYFRKDLVLKVTNGGIVNGEGYVRSQFQDATNFIQTGTGTASNYALDNTSSVSLNSFIGNNIVGLYSHKLFVGKLDFSSSVDLSSATKYKIEVFGGDWSALDTGIATYTVSSRGYLKVVREIHNGSVSHHELKVYQNSSGFDIVLICDQQQFPAMNIRVWKMDGFAYNEMIINKNEYDITAKVDVTPAFIDTFATTTSGNVGIGTTNAISKLQVVGLVEYTDNSSAITAGLTVGAFYRTGDILKIVH